jgi:hypothetical protein
MFSTNPLSGMFDPDNPGNRYLGLGNSGIHVLVDRPQGESPEDSSFAA